MRTATYNLYTTWTTIRDRIYSVLPTAMLDALCDRAAALELAYLKGREHTDDQYDRAADRAVVLTQIIDSRCAA